MLSYIANIYDIGVITAVVCQLAHLELKLLLNNTGFEQHYADRISREGLKYYRITKPNWGSLTSLGTKLAVQNCHSLVRQKKGKHDEAN